MTLRLHRLMWLLALASTAAFAVVDPYPIPGEHLRSPHYQVVVSQGGDSHEVPVLISHAQQPSNPHADTSWAAFAFDGHITIRITRAGDARPPTTARVLPTHAGIVARVSGGAVEFDLSRSGHYALELDGELATHPLLIFAAPPETEIPQRADPKVRWFGPGVHRLSGDPVELSAGETVYLAPGAWVEGRFRAADAPGIRLLGRGVLYGGHLPANPPNTYTVPHLFDLAGASDGAVADGVTMVASPHYNLLLRGADSVARNVKMIGWWYGTDGIAIGLRGRVENCFFKVNDDALKIYNSGMVVTGCVIWQMENGAPFQLTWNLNSDHRGFVVRNCDVIRVEHYQDANNRAVFNSIHGGRADLSDYLFEDIRIEGPIFRLVKLTARLTDWSRSDVLGTISNVRFHDISVEGPVEHPNEIRSYEQTGRFEDITFKNLRIGGRLITNAAEANFHIDPATATGIRFIE
jgi:hypothetical protein